MPSILLANHVSKYFGKLAAVKDLTFHVNEGEIFGIAGPNGAGKSTLFNIITRIPYPPTSGEVFFEDNLLTGLPPHQICHMGIMRTFQVPAFFSTLTVLENMMIGTYFGNTYKIMSILRHNEKVRNESIKILDDMGLLEKKDMLASNLSIFDKKKLMISSALVAKPKVLLLDEPMSGLNATEIEQIMDLIKKINREKSVTTLIIEHIMKALIGLSERIMVLDHGEKICEGAPKEVIKDQRVIKSYLGETI